MPLIFSAQSSKIVNIPFVDIPTTFDLTDQDYLAEHLTVDQLKAEIKRARYLQMLAGIDLQFEGTEFDNHHLCLPDIHFDFDGYITLCQRAIDQIRELNPPPPLPPGSIDAADVKSRVDIVSVVEKYIPLRKVGNRFSGRCPLHEDKHPSLTVYFEQQSWYCYQCNQGGDVFDFLMAAEHTDFRRAVAIAGGSR